MVTPWVATANDVPIEKQLAYQYAVTLKYSTKPTLGLTASYELCKMSIRLTRDFYGSQEDGEDVCLGLVSLSSPMIYNEEMLDAVIAYAEENQPLFFASAVLPGATEACDACRSHCDVKCRGSCRYRAGGVGASGSAGYF